MASGRWTKQCLFNIHKIQSIKNATILFIFFSFFHVVTTINFRNETGIRAVDLCSTFKLTYVYALCVQTCDAARVQSILINCLYKKLLNSISFRYGCVWALPFGIDSFSSLICWNGAAIPKKKERKKRPQNKTDIWNCIKSNKLVFQSSSNVQRAKNEKING